MELVEEGRCRFRIPQRGKMRVQGDDRRAERAEPACPSVSQCQPEPVPGPIDHAVLAGGLLCEQVEVVVQQLGLGDRLIRGLVGQRV